MTSPPRPPSPPSGPPLGTNFSRRKLTAPRPPSPAATSRTTSSRNRPAALLGAGAGRRLWRRRGPGLGGDLVEAEHGQGEDVGPGAVAAGVVEAHRAGAQRVQGVVAPDPDVVPGDDLGASLSDQDGAGEHDLAAVALDAEPAAGAVAAVAGAAAPLLVSHGSALRVRGRGLGAGFGRLGLGGAGTAPGRGLGGLDRLGLGLGRLGTALLHR